MRDDANILVTVNNSDDDNNTDDGNNNNDDDNDKDEDGHNDNNGIGIKEVRRYDCKLVLEGDNDNNDNISNKTNNDIDLRHVNDDEHCIDTLSIEQYSELR